MLEEQKRTKKTTSLRNVDSFSIIVLEAKVLTIVKIFIKLEEGKKKLNKKNNKKMTQERGVGWNYYLVSDSIQRGLFVDIKAVPLSLIQERGDSVANDLRILLASNPKRIVMINNLEKKRKKFLTEILIDELNISAENTVEIALKILKHEKDKEESILAIQFIFSCLNEINKIYFKKSISNELPRMANIEKADLKDIFFN